jgi:hypothetical protein
MPPLTGLATVPGLGMALSRRPTTWSRHGFFFSKREETTTRELFVETGKETD